MISPHQRIKDLRIDLDKSQRAIARVLEISQQQYSRYEISENKIPAHIIIKLAQYYQVSTDYLLGLTNYKQRNEVLDEPIADGTTLGEAIHEWLSLSADGRLSVWWQIIMRCNMEKARVKKPNPAKTPN